MLQPARRKFRKEQKGRNKGVATRGNKVSFGEYGLKAIARGRLTARQIEAARRALDQLPRDQAQANILIGIVQRLAALDPSAAAAWVDQFPQGDLHDRALAQLRRVNSTVTHSLELQR